MEKSKSPKTKTKRPYWILLPVLSAVWTICVYRFCDQYWWATLLGTPPLTYMVGTTLFLLILMLILGKGKEVKGLAAVLMAIVGFLAYHPTPAGPSPGQHLISVMSWNVRSGYSPSEALAKQIKKYDPDVVCLQQSTPQITQELADLLGGYNYRASGQIGILTKLSIIEDQTVVVGEAKERSSILGLRLALEDKKFWVASVHLVHGFRPNWLKPVDDLQNRLDLGSQVRTMQLDAVLNTFATKEEPVLLAGDFNMQPTGFLYRKITRKFVDTAPAFPPVATYPNFAPAWNIDQIFVKDLHSTHKKSISTTLSEHLPVMVEVSLP